MKLIKRIFRKRNKFTVIEVLEEIYPMTGEKLIRPTLHMGRVILTVLLTLVGLGGIAWGLLAIAALIPGYDQLGLTYKTQFILTYLVCLTLCIVICAQRIVIFLIRVYQKFGPYSIRCMCVFVPNCSQYMVMAIEKYGLIKGIKKGRDRLDRCHEPNIGEDYP